MKDNVWKGGWGGALEKTCLGLLFAENDVLNSSNKSLYFMESIVMSVEYVEDTGLGDGLGVLGCWK